MMSEQDRIMQGIMVCDEHIKKAEGKLKSLGLMRNG